MKYSPEMARYLFAVNSEKSWQDFFEALRDGELPTYYCQKFAFKRLFSDDLPYHRLVDSWHPDFPEMKCRGMKIIGRVRELRQCKEQEVIKDPDVINYLDLFINREWNFSRGSRGQYWTTREEIDLINTTLDRVIHSIETTYGITTDWEEARKMLHEERGISRKAYGK